MTSGNSSFFGELGTEASSLESGDSGKFTATYHVYRENRLLVTDEPVRFPKLLVQNQNFRK